MHSFVQQLAADVVSPLCAGQISRFVLLEKAMVMICSTLNCRMNLIQNNELKYLDYKNTP